MRRILLAALLIIGLNAVPAFARGALYGYAQKGGQTVAVAGFVSTTTVQASYPNSTVTVYNTGTTTLTSIYSNAGGTAKANPFTAGADASWLFYAENGDYDIKFSGTGITTPFTYTALRVVSTVNSSVYSIKDYGAVCNGTTDDTTAIQAAITAAQASSVIGVYQPQAPAVYIPGGSAPCKVTGTLTVAAPIRIYGDGKESSVLYTSSTLNAPTILLSPNAGTSTYTIFQLDHFAIKGPNVPTGAYAEFASTLQDNSDGIKAAYTSDFTVEITDMRITGMTGNGINLANRINSPRIARCEIEFNSKAGIRADSTAGGFVTNADIDNNYIRNNRIGILWKSTATNLTTGRIHNNLVESNSLGFNGTVGSADRPSVGIWLYNTYDMNFSDNYTEGQWNAIYCELSCSHNTFSFNITEQGNDYDAVNLNGPPTRRAGIVWASGVNNRWYANHLLSAPLKPAGCSNANWVATGDAILTVTAATNANPIVVTTAAHNMANGGQNKITIANATGNTAANGTFYVNVLSATTFALYTDATLQTTVAGNGAYGANSAIAVVTQYENITDNSGLNIFLYNKTSNVIGNASTITNPDNRHTIISSDFDAGDGPGRAILTEAAWGKKVTLPTLSVASEGTVVGGGAGPGVIEWKQLSTATATSVITLTLFDSSSELFRIRTRIGTGATTDVASILVGGIQFIKFSGFAYGSLGTFMPYDGTIGYCNTCTQANPCAGGGTGAFAKRLNGIYVCN